MLFQLESEIEELRQSLSADQQNLSQEYHLKYVLSFYWSVHVIFPIIIYSAVPLQHTSI